MNYKQTIEYLYNQLPVFQQVGASAYKEGLDNTLALDDYFGHPHGNYRTIHVAGTNGKGSTSHLLAAVLQQSGYKVGLYTSPHLVDFRERIRVNGEKIAEQYVVDFVEKHCKSFEPIYPSFFELTMMMSFCYFADMKVDVAVIEVGLGGRLDSTNIITPDLSIITNISFDHTQFLGDTLEKIAGEKSGIMKNNVPVVIGETVPETRPVFELCAERTGAPLIFAEERNYILSAEHDSQYWLFESKHYPHLKGELNGNVQIKNAATVLCAIEQLQNKGYIIPQNAVYDGFAHVVELTGLMGRWQVLKESLPKIVCDTAHNSGGMQYIADQLKNETYEKLHIVIGMVNDKDITAILKLLPKNAIYYFTRASIARALDEKNLQKQAEGFGLKGNTYPTVNDALFSVMRSVGENDFIYIGGSNFVVAEALESKYIG